MTALQTTDVPFEWIVNSNALGVAFLDAGDDFRISFLSRHAVRRLDDLGLLGRPASSLIGAAATELADSPYFRREKLRQPSNYPAAVRAHLPSATIEFALSPVMSSDDRYLGVMLTFKDVSALVESEEMSSQYRSEMESLVAGAQQCADQAEGATVDLSGAVAKLLENGTKVQSFVTELGMVNSQTKMLSLNASIEAIRAGGASAFVVIAEEMRDLANSVADITDELANLAKAIQGDGAAAASTSELMAGSVSDLVRQQREMENQVRSHAGD
ncbi:MAG: methyl-accepting chemotaxis protein [Actinomycetota bacterium]